MIRYILFLTIVTNIYCTLEEDISEYVCNENMTSLTNFFSKLKKENINVGTGRHGQTPLIAVLSNYEDEDRTTRKKDNNYKTIREIRNARRAKLVNIMLAVKGIDLEITGPNFKSPLWLACDAGNIPVINRLSNSGAKIRSINRAATMASAVYGCGVIDSEFDLNV